MGVSKIWLTTGENPGDYRSAASSTRIRGTAIALEARTAIASSQRWQPSVIPLEA